MELNSLFADEKYPCFLLDDTFGITWQNEAAQQLMLPPAAFALRLDKLEQSRLRRGEPVQQPWQSEQHWMTTLHILPMGGSFVAMLYTGGTGTDGRVRALEQMMQTLQGLSAALPAMRFFVDENSADMHVVEYVMRQTYRLMRSVNDQQWSLRLAGGYRPRFQAVDLDELLGSLCQAVNAALPDTNIIYEKPDRLVPVQADKALLELVITHLLNNSVTYGDQGADIHLRLMRKGGKGIIQLQDSGKGMQPQVAQRAFEPYFSCDPYCDTDIRPGAGLGLYLVRQAMRVMGGESLLETDYGVGTRISLSLPLLPASQLEVRCNMADYLMDRLSCVYLQFAPLGASLHR